MTDQPTIPVPANVAQATVECIAKLPVGQVTELWDAWRQIIHEHNEAQQEKKRPLDPAERGAVDAVLNGAEK